MSISTAPRKAPCSAMWMTRESMGASTVPSTTRVSQSVISTPLSLMFGPTVSWLPPALPLVGVGALAGVYATPAGRAMGRAGGLLAWLVEGVRDGRGSGSRLLKNEGDTAMGETPSCRSHGC